LEVDKTRKILINNKGSGFPLAVAVALCLVIIFTGISEYFRLVITAQGVRDVLQDAVISTVSENYKDVYHGVREGYSGGYSPNSDNFAETVNYGDIYKRMDTVLGLNESSGYHTKTTNEGKTEFKIWDLQVNIRNAPFAMSDQADQRFEIDSSIMLEVPVSFGGISLPSMQIKVKNRAGYTPKF
jgi:hypothetical protein